MLTRQRAATPPRRGTRLKRPPVPSHRTQRLLARLETRPGNCFLTNLHSNNGLVCLNDLPGVHGVLWRPGPQPSITPFIKSDGGSGQASLILMNLLRQHHDSQICSIPEARGIMIFHQSDRERHYRIKDRRRVALNDRRSWRGVERAGRRLCTSVIHISQPAAADA